MLHYFQEECKRVSTEGEQLRLDLLAQFKDVIKVCSLSLVLHLNIVYIIMISCF